MTRLQPVLELAVLGELTVRRESVVIKLPASRKTRALLGYLILSARAHRRDQLCEMFWELPDDPRGALRWSLSKLRAIVDDGDLIRLIADRNTVELTRGGLEIDLAAAESALDVDASDDAVEAALVALRQPLLDGLDLPNSASFTAWLAGQRFTASQLRSRLLQRRATAPGLSADVRLRWCREWLQCDPFNAEAMIQSIQCLGELARYDDAIAAARKFETMMARAALTVPSDLRSTLASPPTEAAPSLELARQKIRFCTAADGVQIAYACVGEGPPLVKAANWLNHLELDWHAPIWAPLFQELARDHCFIRYDGRGNGLSQDGAADINFEAFVRDLETVVDAAGIDRFPLLGLSQGCAVAIEYAARYPERVSHLILWGGYAAGWRVDADAALIAEREAIITLVRAGWGRDDAVYRQMFSADFLPGATSDELTWFNGFQGQTVSAANAARFLEVFADIDVRHRLPHLDVPTLVMHARGDRRIPVSVGSQLASQIPGAEFVSFASDNHLLLGREPASQLFVAHIRRFLAAPSQADAVLTRRHASAS